MTMNKIAALMLPLIALSMVSPEPAQAQAATGHEANCTVTNINWISPDQINLLCASGNVYAAFLNGTQPATCSAVDIDTLKAFESLGIAARTSGLLVTVWYNNTCAGGGVHGIITSVELTGN
jgi:hypothetical protein